MRNILFKLIFPSFFIILFCPVFAQNKDLIINADEVSYDKGKKQIEASGSVEVVYKNVKVYGDHVIYNTETEKVLADRGFNLNYNGISIEGEGLDYKIKDREGEASKVSLFYQGMKMGGAHIELGKETLHFKEALFSTCDFEEPHYRVTARDIVFHPQYGWLVAYWGFFWLGPFPLVPMPTYIYDLRAAERGKKNLPPFPEVGSNDEDGGVINERLAWHVRRELSGTYSISYASRKGIGGGAEADYILNENSKGQARLYGNATDRIWGGITHQFFFGSEVKERTESPFAFFAFPKYQQYELEATLSSRERINYQRVSFYPDLLLKMRKSKLFGEEFKFDAELMLGMVGEENNVNLARGGGKLGVYWGLQEQSFGFVSPSLSLDSRVYSNGRRWTKATGGVGFRKDFGRNFSLGLGYLHYFLNEGQSPFNFEIYRFSASPRFTSQFFFMIGETGLGFDTSHFLDRWQPEDIDYSLFFKLHCYNLMVKYRSLRREFEMGFGLAGG